MASQKCAKQLLSHLSQAQAQNMHLQGWTCTQCRACSTVVLEHCRLELSRAHQNFEAVLRRRPKQACLQQACQLGGSAPGRQALDAGAALLLHRIGQQNVDWGLGCILLQQAGGQRVYRGLLCACWWRRASSCSNGV